MDDPRMTPSRWYYVLAALVLVGGLGLYWEVLYKGLSGMGDKIQQVLAPGRTELTLREPGNYTIFLEYNTVMGGKVHSTDESISGLECELVSTARDSKIAIARSSTNTKYEIDGRSGRSILGFTDKMQRFLPIQGMRTCA
jgi:tRNA A37 N6-isopentenylltransferase MiaA